MTKICTRCKKLKPLSEYYKKKSGKQGATSVCKMCVAKKRAGVEKNMTHGELYVYKRENLDFTKDVEDINKELGHLPPKMSKKEAIEYYGGKIHRYFIATFWGGVDAYYDYFEAKRLKKIR